jgi:hypothetical protein
MSRECLATSLGMPGISEGLHAKMSALARRKSTSTTSYFGSRVELTLNALPSGAEGSMVEMTLNALPSGAVGSRGTSLVCSVASKLPAC